MIVNTKKYDIRQFLGIYCFVVFIVEKSFYTYGTNALKNTVCPRSSDQFYVVTYYIKWVTTSWTDSRRYIMFGSYIYLCD